MVGVLAVALLALFAVSGCSGMDDNANSDNANANNTENADNANNGNDDSADSNSDNNNADNSQSDKVQGFNGEADGTMLRVPNGWIAYSGSDMIVLVDSSTEPGFEWSAEIDGNSVLKDTDADLPSSTYYDQSASDVVGAPGMHVFGFVADDQTSGDSTITLKLMESDSSQPQSTIVLKATAENGAFTKVDVQES